jgi:hypothetical protein
MFKDGQANKCSWGEQSGRPAVVSDDLVQSVDQKICERQGFKISELSCEFPQISSTLLYEIISYARLLQVLHNMGSKNAHGCTQNREWLPALTFLE